MQSGEVPDGRQASYPDADAFARIAAEFDALRSLSPAEREGRWRDLAAAAPAVAAEVKRLLALHDGDVGRLADPAQLLDPTLLASAFAETRPDQVGPYRLQQQIGQGGMGAVYRAERVDGEFQQVVAVKLLQPGAASGELQGRFRTERRILASLRHANIASLLDGGSTADGRAYVVMEYVDGLDLMTHCERNRLGLRARLELFCQVCGAVEHAHRNLVVHRDLKPANILVTAEGEPKLLDFGIAKLLQHDATATGPALTITGSMLLTPEYASPEQVRGDNITTATDVYALGVILHELLTGQRAQSFTTRTPRELEQVVCEQQPPLPSQAIAAPSSPLPAMGVSRARLQRLLAGDLDTIVQRAQHKEPLRRYGNAGDLADDIRRHLRGQPVLARPDTFAYQARKFLRRHRWPVTAAAAFVALLVTATLVTANMARTSAQQRDVAERKSALALRISDFMVDLFKMAEPDPARAEQLSARALLDRGSKRIGSELGEAPLVRAGLQDAMGRAYTRLGLYEKAAPLLQDALELRRHNRSGTVDEAHSLQHLGQLYAASGEVQQAEPLLQKAVELSQQLGDRDAVTESQNTMASLLNEAGRSDEALQLAQQLLAEATALPDAAPRATANALLLLGIIDRDRSDYAPAIDCLQRSLAVLQQLYGQDNPVAAEVYRALGSTHKDMGNYGEAKAALQRAVDLDRQLLGDHHPDVDSDLFAMAMLEADIGDPAQAEELLRQVLRRDRHTFGDRHPYVALDLGQLATLLSDRGDFKAAEPLFLEALSMQRELLPKDHPELATTLNNLGVLYHRQRRLDEAEKYFREALTLREKILPADHPALLTSRNLMAVLEQDRGNFKSAEAQFRSVLQARLAKLGDHCETAGSYYSLAISVAAQGRNDEAEQLLRESLRIYRDTLPPHHLDLGRPLLKLGVMQLARGNATAAEPLLREATVCRQEHLDADHPELIRAECELGSCLTRLGNFDEADKVLQQARARCVAGDGLDTAVGKRVAAALQALATAQKAK